jgi:hypothetical protein
MYGPKCMQLQHRELAAGVQPPDVLEEEQFGGPLMRFGIYQRKHGSYAEKQTRGHQQGLARAVHNKLTHVACVV